MKAISILQPWASLIVLGHKRIETRSWNTKYRGRLLIHASAKYAHDQHQLALNSPFFQPLKDAGYQFFGLPGGRNKISTTMPLGAIIGEVELVNTETSEKILANLPKSMYWGKENELAFGDYSPNRYGWYVNKPFSYPVTFPAKGKLGIWDYDGPLEFGFDISDNPEALSKAMQKMT
jgi:activating signal cointegrator 1